MFLLTIGLRCIVPPQGKVMLAFESSEVRQELFERIKFEVLTPSTITGGGDLKAELGSVIAKGDSFDVSEMTEGCPWLGWRFLM